MKDETSLIAALAHESEKIDNKNSFFLPSIKRLNLDYSVTGWNDTKTFSTYFKSQEVHRSKCNLSKSEIIHNSVKLINMPQSLLRLKFNEIKTCSLDRSPVIKISNIILKESGPKSQPVKMPKLPHFQQNGSFSISKRSKNQRKNESLPLAQIKDVIKMLRPKYLSAIKQKIENRLRPKPSLIQLISTRNIKS